MDLAWRIGSEYLGWEDERARLVEKMMGTKSEMKSLLSFARLIGAPQQVHPGASIRAAIAAAPRWSTIMIMPGWHERGFADGLVIDKPLRILGAAALDDLRPCGWSGEMRKACRLVNCSMTFAPGCRKCLLHNLDFFNFTLECGGGDVTITHCAVRSNDCCIEAWGDCALTLRHCQVQGGFGATRYGLCGVRLTEQASAFVVASHFDGFTECAIHVQDQAWAHVEGNRFTCMSGSIARASPPASMRYVNNSLDAESGALEDHEVVVQENIVHVDEATQIQPQEAAHIATEQYVSWTLFNAASLSSSDEGRPPSSFEPVVLHRYSRCPGPFHAILNEGDELEPVRAALAEAGHSWQLPSGAKVFVHPEDFSAVRASLAARSLRPHHVVVSQAFEPLVREALARLPSRLHVDDLQAEHIALADGHGDVVCVQRTFLDIPRLLRSAQSVVQSTTEAHHVGAAQNPRRLCPLSDEGDRDLRFHGQALD